MLSKSGLLSCIIRTQSGAHQKQLTKCSALRNTTLYHVDNPIFVRNMHCSGAYSIAAVSLSRTLQKSGLMKRVQVKPWQTTRKSSGCAFSLKCPLQTQTQTVLPSLPHPSFRPLVFTGHRRTYSEHSDKSEMRNTSSHLLDKHKEDPEVKEWLRLLSADFGTAEKNFDQSKSESGHDNFSEHSSETIPGNGRQQAGMDQWQREAVTAEEVEKQLARYDYEEAEDYEEDEAVVELPISMERGKRGVFDVEEIVILLRDERAQDLCVIVIPPELHYVDHMVLCTGRSSRHVLAMAEFMRWVYKQKRAEYDPPTVDIEGRQASDWLALDFGNIALHIFLAHTREKYDLETLWTVGPEYDDKVREVDEADTIEEFAWETLINELGKYGESSGVHEKP